MTCKYLPQKHITRLKIKEQIVNEIEKNRRSSKAKNEKWGHKIDEKK